MATLPPFFSSANQGQQLGPILDRDKFEKELTESISKALLTTEVPVKEKHVRNIILSTWREKGCTTFWKIIHLQPLDRNNVICYKSCYVIHKVLRDGYSDNAKKSATQAKFVSELAKHWNQLGNEVSKMITSYLKIVWNKIAFHVKNPDIPASFNFTDKPFIVPSDIDVVFQMTVEAFDFQSAILHFFAAVLATIEPNNSVSNNVKNCRIGPFVPAIKDSAALYDVVYKLMKALHTSLPADTLQGHRDRFTRQYHALRKYFKEIGKMEYIKKFVDIPELPPEPPNFLIGSFNELMLSQQIITHDINVEESLPSISQVEATDNVMSATLIELQQPETTPIAPNQSEQSLFDITFGTKEFEPFVPDEQLQSISSSSLAADERDILIEQLMREIVELKEKVALLEEQNEANQELLASLKMQLEQKDKELLDIKEVAEQACNENVQLKQEIEEKSVMSMAASDEKSKALEQKFVQLRDVYQKLRNEHIQLLRNNGEIQKKLNKAESDLINEESSRMDLEKSVTSLNLEIQKVKRKASDDSTQMSVIMESLKSKEIETSKLKESTSSLHQQLQDSQQANIQSSIVQAIEQSKIIISKTIGEIDNSSLTCTPGHLLTKIPNGQSVINGLTASFSTYSKDPTALGSVLANISSYTQSMNEIILYGAAAGRLASADKEQNMTRMCKDIGNSCIELLDCLKAANPNMEVAKRLSNGLVKSIGSLSVEAEELKKELDAQEESTSPLGDVVEEEMAVTSLAVNEAAQRIEEILKRSRTEQTGVNLEVNSRILTSCTDLMKAIQMLMTRSRELQQEIVAEGMGTSNDTKDFYKKNNTWSEGLISAAKQVGYGASRLVDTADKVVRGDGKFEALIVNSHDIAASTAQLVAASKVKARAKSEKLQALKSSSRTVSEATGSVVASAQSGAEIKAEAATKIDFTKLSLNQTKRLEMESQVKALELEKELEMERKRLAELRKVHYHKAGASEGWDEEVTS